MKINKRICYICMKCDPKDGARPRVFVTDSKTPPPRCSAHGRMTIQGNQPYRGQPV